MNLHHNKVVNDNSTADPASADVPGAGRLELAAVAELPTRFGAFKVRVFLDRTDGKEHVALVHGEVFGKEDVATRLHSECLTGDVFGSLRCDCREQLELGLKAVAAEPCGVVLYLRQEGRGIGLANKIRAYSLQELGLDTVDANRALGFRDDERDYAAAAFMLKELGIRSVRLLTNNPDKIRQLESHGARVSARVPHAVPPGEHNRRYLETKVARSGHLMHLGR
jgi:GTP cyclohydrolase II